MSSCAGFAMCRKIQSLFLVVAGSVWIVLIEEVLELGEDVFALVLDD